jgi:hypothetical protein
VIKLINPCGTMKENKIERWWSERVQDLANKKNPEAQLLRKWGMKVTTLPVIPFLLLVTMK